MSKERPLLILDTNVWIDDALFWRKGHGAARELITYALSHGAELAYALTSIKDVFYISAQKMKDYAREMQGELTEAGASAALENAWNIALAMNDVATPIGMDVSDVWMASKLRAVHNDLEDNLVIAAGERAGADFIVTDDKNLLSNPHVHALTAEDMLEHLKLFEP